MSRQRWVGMGRALATLGLVVTGLGGGATQARPVAEDAITFPQTGQTLSATHGFLAYWQAHGGLAQFGYPLSAEVREVSPTDGRVYVTQWFERNRFEWHPENADPQYQVLLGLLGNTLTAGRRAAGAGVFNPTTDAHFPGGRYFAQTGHNLRNSFQAYWQDHGGLALYGYPISEEFTEASPTDGKPYTVQYFERNRFEWHPENAGTPYTVLLGLLGAQIGGFPVPPVPPADTTTPLIVPAAFRNTARWQIPHPMSGPAGMQISLFGTADLLRMMAVAPNGDLFVSATRANRVWVMPDRDGDGVSDGSTVFAGDVDKPHGLAFHQGYLYVAAEKAVYRYPYTSGQTAAAGPGEKIADLPFGTSTGLVDGNNHDTRSITFGPDGTMFISVGSDCDLCSEGDPRRAAILAFHDDGSAGRVYAGGLRNAVGLDIDPRSGLLWAAVNERNKAGNDFPPDLFTPIRDGGNYGWPDCQGIPLQPDPIYTATVGLCAQRDSAPVGLPAHIAPLGMRFYEGGGQLPHGYDNGAFIAMHGSSLHDPTYGADIRYVSLRPGQMAAGATVAVSGWLVDGHYWGRPVDVVFRPDGALYISDELAGAVYRVTVQP
ncbi:MAG: PQQ-dependent sugar dehydrogenase [Chloroflexota bacterium]|nr:PQQ-dependent sugar dehydrogenase [Chloroflexota bacterium]